MQRHTQPRWSKPLALLMAMLASTAMAAVDIDGTYRNRELGVKIVLPEGWRLTVQNGYPALLARITWKKTSVMLSYGSLAPPGDETNRPRTLQAFVEQNSATLAAIGLVVRSTRPTSWGKISGWEITVAPFRQLSIEQYYIKRGKYVLIWTVKCPTSELKLARLNVARLIESALSHEAR